MINKIIPYKIKIVVGKVLNNDYNLMKLLSKVPKVFILIGNVLVCCLGGVGFQYGPYRVLQEM